MGHNILEIIVLALAVSTVSITICETKVFKPFRVFAKWVHPWVGALFSCPYCLSHWISAGVVAIYRFKLVHNPFSISLIDYAVTVFVIVFLSSFASFVLCKILVAMDGFGEKAK